MKIVFMGTPGFALPSLELLLGSPHEISAVVTVPDKPQGRGLKVKESAVKQYALKNGLSIFQPESLKDTTFIGGLGKIEPDIIVVVAFRILPKEIFQIPRYGSFNLHASLLPKYRGPAPINWAIINGEKETGVTTFFLNEFVDTGNIILQNKCGIAENDDAGSLHDRLSVLGAETVLSTVNLIEKNKGNVPVYSQEERLFTRAPKITREFCRINWDNSAVTIHNFIRGLSPAPAAYTTHSGKIIKIFQTQKQSSGEEVNGLIPSPGKVIVSNGKLFVSANDRYLEIMQLQLEGKKRLASSEFLKGYSFAAADILGT